MDDINFKFINPVNEELIRIFFQRTKNNLMKMHIIFNVILIASTILMFFFNNILFYIFFTLFLLLNLLYIIVYVFLNNNCKNTIKNTSSNATQEISVFEDHLFIHLKNGCNEATNNIEWHTLKTYDDYRNALILNLDNMVFIIDKKQLTNEQIDFFTEKAIKCSGIINNKKKKRRTQ